MSESSDPYAVGGQRRTSGLAIASLAAGIVGLFIAPLIVSVVAIVLGHAARRELSRDPVLAGSGFALAGIVLGWVGVAIGILFVLVILVFVGGVG